MQNGSDRRGYFSRRKSRGRYLIEQRLEGVMILAVDDGNAHRRAGQHLRRVESSEARADDYDTMCCLSFSLAVHSLADRTLPIAPCRSRSYSIRFSAMATGSISSSVDLHPAWVRWLVPSVGEVFFAVLLSLLVFTGLSVRLLGDAGIGWHIRTGQMILATHAIPHVDSFSSAMSGQPWFAWEWCYDLIVGWLESVAGLNGVVLFTGLVIALVFAWTFRLLLRRGTNVVVAVILVLLAASASMIHFLARPHVVSWLFTLVCFWILESSVGVFRIPGSSSGFEAGRAWRLAGLPLCMGAWVNLHGGFLVGLVLIGIYWIDAVWQWCRLKEDRFDDGLRKIPVGRRIRNLTIAGILSGLATLANPYGFHLYVHIYRYLSDRFLMDHIDEFQSPNFHYVAQKCFAGLLLLTLVALAVKKRGVGSTRLSQALVVLFAVYSGLYASRNIPVSSLLLVLMIGPWLSEGMEKLLDRRAAVQGVASMRFLQRMQAVELSLRGHLWPIATVVLACWIAANGGKLGASTLMDAHFDPKRFPVAAVDHLESDLEKKNLPGPIVSPDSWGGYLIYRLYPQVRMVVDDRHDFYGDEFVKSYLKMVNAEPGWQDFLQQHAAQCVFAPRNSALASILAETSGWKAIYTDDVATVFVRTRAPVSENAKTGMR
jgi:hypothetical protein